MASTQSHREMFKTLRAMVDNSERVVLEDIEGKTPDNRKNVMNLYDKVREDLELVSKVVNAILGDR